MQLDLVSLPVLFDHTSLCFLSSIFQIPPITSTSRITLLMTTHLLLTPYYREVYSERQV